MECCLKCRCALGAGVPGGEKDEQGGGDSGRLVNKCRPQRQFFVFLFFFYAQDNRTLLRLRFFGFSVNSLTKFKIRF